MPNDPRRPRRTPAPKASTWEEYYRLMVSPERRTAPGVARTPLSEISPFFDTPPEMPDLERDYDSANGIPRWKVNDRYPDQQLPVRFRDGDGAQPAPGQRRAR
jgi:hypothetical protein